MTLGLLPYYFASNGAFRTQWKTDNPGTSASNQITLPLITSGNGGIYNCSVEWGDGTTDIIRSSLDAAVTHTYPSAGTYNVVIRGTCVGWQFNNGGNSHYSAGAATTAHNYLTGTKLWTIIDGGTP